MAVESLFGESLLLSHKDPPRLFTIPTQQRQIRRLELERALEDSSLDLLSKIEDVAQAMRGEGSFGAPRAVDSEPTELLVPAQGPVELLAVTDQFASHLEQQLTPNHATAYGFAAFGAFIDAPVCAY